MIESYIILLAIVCAVPIAEAWRTTRKKVNGMPLPPGPRLLPFVGNALDIDIARPWLTYAKWAKQYGDIVYTRFLGLHFVVINSEKVARAIVDKRSAIYSDRPHNATNEYFGMSFNTALLPYGDTFRTHRKIFHQTLRAEASNSYQDLYLRKAHELVVNLLDAPEDIERHFNTLSASLIMAVTYGYETKPRDDPFVNSVQKVIRIATHALSPETSAWMMLFASPDRLPSFFPGGKYMKQAPECRRLVKEVMEKPFEYVKKQMAKGVAHPSMVSDFLNQGDKSQVHAHEQMMKEVAAAGYIAGSETTSSTMHMLILALLLYPEVQARARAEIDAVCGSDRIPTLHDRNSLPYIEATCREILRWKPVVPLGIPHATSSDDVYDGFFIPKGVLISASRVTDRVSQRDGFIVANSSHRVMAHDEEIYPNPSRFDPSRHLTADGKLKGEPTSSHFVFGYGRRICPGRFFSDNAIWASVVSILSTVEITNAKDEDGKDIDVKPEFTSGLSIHPTPFPCSIRSVSSAREAQMRMMWKADPVTGKPV
ncbi:cytochrome P450 [Suillus paluster]|uniref:cytochrome P450 n=1 Tax=Suillus paluster TaxID=48578 RepID=UPI001B87658A|nr:cytochrome P450 [Suillus paluster]KAG1735609.1 cytochrome P450 [Suillus paluster]